MDRGRQFTMILEFFFISVIYISIKKSIVSIILSCDGLRHNFLRYMIFLIAIYELSSTHMYVSKVYKASSIMQNLRVTSQILELFFVTIF